MGIAPSELILNADGSIYHLNLKPQDLATTVITVGDPDRVERVTRHFDHIRLTRQKREFKTQTGTFKGKEITVISTGIGTDNVDIVLNELDALINVDFATRRPKLKKSLSSLTLIRLGTSGAIQADVPLDSILLSERAVGLDSLLHFYDSDKVRNQEIEQALVRHTQWAEDKSTPYVVDADRQLLKHFAVEGVFRGMTVTNVGFYGPQGRRLRAIPSDTQLVDRLQTFRHYGLRITNLEMETSGIYGLSQLLGHRALSINAILANRALGTFSSNAEETVDGMIEWALGKVGEL